MFQGKWLTIGKVRGGLYRSARVLGDVNAVLRGTIGKRVLRRLVGSWTNRAIDAAMRGWRRR